MRWLQDRRRPKDEDLEQVEPLVLPPPPNPDFYDPAWDAWKPARTVPPRVIVAIVVVALLVIAGVFASSALRSSKRKGVAPVFSVTPTTFMISRGAIQAPDVLLSGNSNQTTSQFTAPSGLVVFSVRCKCVESFGITILDPSGSIVSIPMNATNTGQTTEFTGSAASQLSHGSYQLKVHATGPWAIAVSFPVNVPPVTLPRQFGSIGPAVMGPFPGGKAIPLFYAFGGTANPPAQLQIIGLDGTPGPVLFSLPILPVIKELVIPPQATNFYLEISNTPAGWALQAEAPK